MYTERPYNLIQIPGDTYSIKGQVQFMINSLDIIKKGNYDIIHAKNPFSSLFSPVILKTMKRIKSRLIYDMRGLWIDFGVETHRFSPALSIFLKKIEKSLTNQCDALIAISPTLKDILGERGYDTEKIFVIVGAGVNIHRIDTLPELKKESTVKGTIIGYIGTISTGRQSEKIIEAFTKIKKSNINLIMIGPIIEPDIFTNITSHHKSICLKGFLPQEEALQYLKTFDIAVSYHDTNDPAYNVAIPTKILEYMAAGIPIVATDHVMYTNILENGKTALLTKQNPEDFARGITHLIDNPDLAAQLAANARVKVRQYSVERIVDQLESVYSQVVKLSNI
jgi:glycosyltransferase involved in cell wall biosynthesis